jgi:magnesium-transporting ATPase (P-type)
VFSNPWFWFGIGAMLILQLALTYWLPLNTVFQTAPIGWRQWLEIVAFAWLCSMLIGLEKRWSPFHVKPV